MLKTLSKTAPRAWTKTLVWQDGDVETILVLSSCTNPDAPKDEADTWITAQEMGRALTEKFTVRYLSGDDPSVFDELVALRNAGGVVLNMMERSQDAGWPAILEKLGVPYTGCDAFTLLLSTNKPWMKLFAERAGLRVARGATVHAGGTDEPDLEFPVIVKPAAEDASVGIRQENVCCDYAELRSRLSQLSQDCAGPWLVEEYIPGSDATVPIYAENGHATVMPILEVRFDKLPEGGLPILSYEAKWAADSPLYTGHSELCPAELPDDTVAEMTSGTASLVAMLNLTGYARVDFRLDEDRKPWFLEFNGNPRLSEKDCYFVRSSREAGMTYLDILERIVSIADCRKGR